MKVQINRDKLYLDYTSFKRECEKKYNKFISHQDMADVIGISRATMWRLFHSSKNISLENVKLVTDYLGQPLDNYIINENH